MVHTRWGVGQLRAAEVRRGCIFAEDLSSVDGVIRNGGVIGSGAKFVSPTEGFQFSGGTGARINYGDVLRNPLTAMTVSAWFKCDASVVGTRMSIFGQDYGITFGMYISSANFLTFSRTGITMSVSTDATPYRDGNWHYAVFTWASGTASKLYVDGILKNTGVVYTGTVSASAGDKYLCIGQTYNGVSEAFKFKGSIRNCMVFNTALDADEIAAYYNGSMFRYDDYCVCDLPFDIAHHDTVNKRSLDVSGYNNHATWGDGSTSTAFPTKLANSRGYSFDGGDYMRTPIVPTEKMSVYSLAYVVGPAINNYLFGSTAAGTTVRFFLYSATTTDVFGFGAGSGILSSSQKSTDGIIHGIVARHDSARNYIHCDGKQVLQSDLARTVANGVPMFIGAYSNNGAVSGALLNGSKMFSLKIFDNIFLNQIQCLDLDIRAKECLSKC